MASYKWFINVISEDLGKMLFNLCNKSIVLHSLSFFYVIFDYSNIVLKFFCETWLAIVSLMINIFISASMSCLVCLEGSRWKLFFNGNAQMLSYTDHCKTVQQSCLDPQPQKTKRCHLQITSDSIEGFHVNH